MQAWPTIMMLHLAVDPKLLYNNRKCYYLHVIGPVAIIGRSNAIIARRAWRHSSLRAWLIQPVLLAVWNFNGCRSPQQLPLAGRVPCTTNNSKKQAAPTDAASFADAASCTSSQHCDNSNNKPTRAANANAPTSGQYEDHTDALTTNTCKKGSLCQDQHLAPPQGEATAALFSVMRQTSGNHAPPSPKLPSTCRAPHMDAQESAYFEHQEGNKYYMSESLANDIRVEAGSGVCQAPLHCPPGPAPVQIHHQLAAKEIVNAILSQQVSGKGCMPAHSTSQTLLNKGHDAL